VLKDAHSCSYALTGDMTEQEQEDADLIDEDDKAELMSQLFENLESGEDNSDQDEGSEDLDDDDDDDDNDDGDDDDDDEDADDLEEDEEDDDAQQTRLAWLGMGARAVSRQLARFPKLSTCAQETLLHPAAQLLNLSSAAVNGKHCLSPVSVRNSSCHIEVQDSPATQLACCPPHVESLRFPTDTIYAFRILPCTILTTSKTYHGCIGFLPPPLNVLPADHRMTPNTAAAQGDRM